MKIHNNEYKREIDIQEIYDSLSEKHRNLFWYKIEDNIFICRTLGRIEFKNLVNDERWTEFDKEEIICEACVLHPESFDFHNCDAGLPTNLTKVIIERSGLDSIETRKNIMDYYRQEMSDIDHQITCMINEAFPQHDIEEIETWDIEMTSKYLSRAEWKLATFRGMEVLFDPFEENQDEGPITEEIGNKEETNMMGGKKEKMTPEKIAQLEAQFPGINWGEDEVQNKGLDAFSDDDSRSHALRPGVF